MNSLTYSKKLMKHFKNPKYVKKLKNPDAVGEVGNIRCLLPEEKILLNNKFEEIKKSKEGDKVFSHNLKENKIIHKFSRDYRGEIIVLQNSLGKISLTTEHLVYAIKIPKGTKYFKNKGKRTLVPAWYHCEDLKKGDISLYPINKEIKDIKKIKIDIPRLKWDFKSKPIPKEIKLDGEFLRLCGYFLAEGHISEGNCRNYITICFNTDEEEYAKDVKNIVKNIFGLNVIYRVDNKKNILVIYIYSAILARFFKKLFNKGAGKKSIPDIFMKLPIQKQKSLIEGMWKGDGYINLNRKGPRAGYATISYNLSQQLKELLLRQGIISSIYTEKERKSKWANHKEAYRIHVGQRDSLEKISKILGVTYSPKSYKSITSWIDNNYLYIPITKVKKEKYSGKVFNLEVEDSHSFISEAFCLHNCGDIMRLELNIDKKTQKIKDIGFQTFGCPAAVSSSDVVCSLAKGKTIHEAKKLSKNDIVKKLGGMPPIKVHCSVLGIQALNKAIEDYEEKQ